MTPLTEPQRRALSILLRHQNKWIRGAWLGHLMEKERVGDGRRTTSSQGLARLGGTMGARLAKLELAFERTDGWAREFQISRLGIAALGEDKP